MSVEIRVPVVGESITEGILVSWARNDGDWVEVDDPLFELETDKITMSVTAQAAGRLSIGVPPETQVEIGQVVGAIEAGEQPAEAAKPAAPQKSSASAPERSSASSPPAASAAAPPKSTAARNSPAGAGDGAETRPGSLSAAIHHAEQQKVVSDTPDGSVDRDGPAVRRMLAEHQLRRSDIVATGRDGRLTKGDVLEHLASSPSSAARPFDSSSEAARGGASSVPGSSVSTAAGPPPPSSGPAPVAAAPQSESSKAASKASVVALPHRAPEAPSADVRQTREKMTSLRKRIAERLVEAQHTAAILSTFNEVDMSQVMALRARYKEAYQKKHGVSLGFMSFFVKAVVEALQLVPKINAQIDGDTIVQNHFYDIGVAVGTDRGLVVPIVRDADKRSFAEIEIEIKRLAEKARTRTLSLDDLTGGCFTISNGGVYGSLLSTPILNPPQSGILGMHGIKDRPIAVDGQVVVRPMMYLALSYDHRLVDGSEAVGFLRRVVECVENPERMMLGI